MFRLKSFRGNQILYVSYAKTFPPILANLPTATLLQLALFGTCLIRQGFLFLYELMRGDLLCKLHANDSGHALGCTLMRLLPPADTQQKGFLMSVLRVMMHNPQLARHLPNARLQSVSTSCRSRRPAIDQTS